jgi:hypothetical protein
MPEIEGCLKGRTITKVRTPASSRGRMHGVTLVLDNGLEVHIGAHFPDVFVQTDERRPVEPKPSKQTPKTR